MYITGSSNAYNGFVPTHDLKYMQLSNVNVSCFVSVKLSGSHHYHLWKAQMLCLMQSQNLLYIIHDEQMIGYYERIVKGWILGSLNEKVLKIFVEYNSAGELWRALEGFYGNPTEDEYGSELWNTRIEDLKYMQASNVNVSSFVSVKLSGHNNFHIWKAQMLCLIETQNLLNVIDKSYPFPEEKGEHMRWKYQTLVRGWIFGSMNEELLKSLIKFFNYHITHTMDSTWFIWRKLNYLFDPVNYVKGDAVIEEIITEDRIIPEIDKANNIILNKELYEAAVEGCWWKAKQILKVNINAATEAITSNGHTILHIAVEMGHSYFVEKVLDFIKDGKDIEKTDNKGRTALHIAAMVGNNDAAQLLVQRRENLLGIGDHQGASPMDTAFNNMQYNISAYLFESALSSGLRISSYEDQKTAIIAAILTKQYDLAEKLLKEDPTIVTRKDHILMAITMSFPIDLGLMESFIYPSFHDVRHKIAVRGSWLFHSNFWDKCVDDILQVVKICNNKCCGWLGKNSMVLLVPIATLYPIYLLICLLILVISLTFSVLYFLLWKVLAVCVRPIKNIEKKKKEHQEGKKILSLICTQMGSSIDDYKNTILEVVRQDNYEVVDEILFASPKAINCEDEEGHNIIQLAIKNRSEKVYNLIYHIIERNETYKSMMDSSWNNLVHLAGKLAPSSVLSRTTGAALQLQRELLWFEEVEKLRLPIELTLLNLDKETPAMVFTREHQDLMKQGENWMKTTAESCSITAALIVTIVFAASITVPGGNQQESGIPVFKKEIAFTIFAVSNAFSLFTAATSLLLFLSILTARFSERDFLVGLPRRLILGLFTLFLSTAAMIVAFGAILFLVFCDQKPWMLAPICGFASLPILVIVTIKLPLLVDLIRSTYFPIFGKQSYLKSCKFNRKNIIIDN